MLDTKNLLSRLLTDSPLARDMVRKGLFQHAAKGAAAVLALVLGLTLSGPAAAASDSQTVSCEAEPTVRGIDDTAEKKVQITADDISFPERGVVHLKGYTQLLRGGHRVYADELTYNKSTDKVVARGVVKFETPQGDVIRTSVLHYDVATGRMESGPATFLIADRKSKLLGDGHSTVNAHGTAQRVIMRDGKTMDLTDAHVTSCLDGEKDATFTAESLTVDAAKGIRTAERAKVRISAPERHEKLDEALKSIE